MLLNRQQPPLILSVDDEAALLYTREKVLQGQGYEVLSADDGKKALEIFAAYPVDLVLLDYVMPGMDGGVVAQQMKRQKPLVPIIMVSANHVPKEALANTDGYIVKGLGPESLLANIKQFLVLIAGRRQPAQAEDAAKHQPQSEPSLPIDAAVHGPA